MPPLSVLRTHGREIRTHDLLNLSGGPDDGLGPAIPGACTMPIVNRVADMQPEITSWRRDFHAHPELQFDVHRTAASVAERLKSFGCDDVVTGIGRTGVVGVISGRRPAASGA